MAYYKKLGDNKYFVRVSKGTGNSREQYSRTIRGNKSDAQKWAREQETKLDLGQPIRPNAQTFKEFYDKWIKQVKKKVSPNTFSLYSWAMNDFFIKPFGKRKLTHIKRSQIQDILNQAHDDGYKTGSIQGIKAAIVKFFTDAVKSELIQTSPATFLELPAREHKEFLLMDEAEAVRFVKACAEQEFGLIFEFALETGTRPNEYLALRWSDIDFERGLIRITRGVQWKPKGSYYFKKPKTKQSIRQIEISDGLLRKLRRHKTAQGTHRLKKGALYLKLDLVFADGIGQPLRRQFLYQQNFKPFIKELNLDEKLTLYSLRHTCCSLLLQHGINIKVISERMGHSSVTITLNRYAHVMPNQQKEATEVISRILAG